MFDLVRKEIHGIFQTENSIKIKSENTKHVKKNWIGIVFLLLYMFVVILCQKKKKVKKVKEEKKKKKKRIIFGVN